MALRRIRALAAVVVVVTAWSTASGCTEPAVDPVPTPSTSASTPAPSAPSSSTPTASPTPDAKTQRARREVLALVDKYYRVDEAIATNPKVPLKRYYEVAGGDYAQSLLQAAQLQRAKDYKVIGKVRLGPTKVRKMRRNESAEYATATVSTCIDVSKVNVVDKRGKSVVQPGRANAYIETLSLRKKKYGWRVFDGKDKEATRCDD